MESSDAAAHTGIGVGQIDGVPAQADVVGDCYRVERPFESGRNFVRVGHGDVDVDDGEYCE